MKFGKMTLQKPLLRLYSEKFSKVLRKTSMVELLFNKLANLWNNREKLNDIKF